MISSRLKHISIDGDCARCCIRGAWDNGSSGLEKMSVMIVSYGVNPWISIDLDGLIGPKPEGSAARY